MHPCAASVHSSPRTPTAAGGPGAPRARVRRRGAAAAQELRSLAQQLGFSYAANIRAAAPAHLHLTSMAGRMGDLLRRQLSGLENWAVTRSEAPYLDLFAGRTEQLVYLTAGARAAAPVAARLMPEGMGSPPGIVIILTISFLLTCLWAPCRRLSRTLNTVKDPQVHEPASERQAWSHARLMTCAASPTGPGLVGRADSPNELQALDSGKAYVIGGLVDRNRHKDLCASRARAAGIATARLPVGQHFKLTAAAVLTVNQARPARGANLAVARRCLKRHDDIPYTLWLGSCRPARVPHCAKEGPVLRACLQAPDASQRAVAHHLAVITRCWLFQNTVLPYKHGLAYAQLRGAVIRVLCLKRTPGAGGGGAAAFCRAGRLAGGARAHDPLAQAQRSRRRRRRRRRRRGGRRKSR